MRCQSKTEMASSNSSDDTFKMNRSLPFNEMFWMSSGFLFLLEYVCFDFVLAYFFIFFFSCSNNTEKKNNNVLYIFPTFLLLCTAGLVILALLTSKISALSDISLATAHIPYSSMMKKLSSPTSRQEEVICLHVNRMIRMGTPFKHCNPF